MVLRLLLLALPALLSCKDKAADTGRAGDGAWRPELVCPGDAGCLSNDGPLMAGAAAVTITPNCFETWDDVDTNAKYASSVDVFYDCGCDQLCEGDEGWPGADMGEGDGEFQAIWIAGFGTARAAASVHDDLWARALVVQSGDTSVAIVALDVVGWFFDDAERIADAVADQGVDIDRILVHATHSHEGPDTLGQWGRRVGESGFDEDYGDFVVERAAAAIAQAASEAQDATLTPVAVDTAAPFGSKGTRNTIRDSRDPVVIDETLYGARFAAADGSTIATLVNWGNHPEVLSSDNLELTSDFAHYLRAGIEDGVQWETVDDRDGLGGVAIFVNGTVGGLMTPLGITVTDIDGVDHEGNTWEKADAIGSTLASLALDAFAVAEPVSDPTVSVRSAELTIPIENFGFQALFLVGVFERELLNFDPDADLDDDNIPEVMSRIDLVDIGPMRMLTAPGEMDPELTLGGYDQGHVNTAEVEFIGADNPNPPDISAAPDGPYLKDRMGAEYNLLLGLTNDELGYIVAPYNYQLDDVSPYLSEAEGDHYEETNSVGPQIALRVIETATTLIEWAE